MTLSGLLAWRGRAGLLAALIVLAGCALRLYRLGSIPPGLNSDEAAAGVEAMALLLTSADRWGNHLPVYFPGWGSGLNVLYSYLSLPVVSLLGLSTVSIRLVNAAFGCLTLPLVWLVARRHFGAAAALVATALVAFMPWHVMASRWALESNLLPFWFTLGLLTIGLALRPGAGRLACTVALLPWAVALYAYAAGVVPIALTALVLLAFHWRAVVPRLAWWGLGGLLALVVGGPFLLFLVKNQVLHRSLDLEAWLPFSAPMLPASRLAQAQGPVLSIVRRNLTFFLDGWRDGLLWNHSAHFAPLSGLVPWLALLGMIERGRQAVRCGRPDPVLAAALSILGVGALFVFNINRINWFFIPAAILAAHALVRLHGALAQPGTRAAFLLASSLYLGGYAGTFLHYYFTRYNAEVIGWENVISDSFRVGLREALEEAVAEAGPAETMLVEVSTFHPYVWVLFFGYGDLRSFRETRRMQLDSGFYRVLGFGRFVFERDALPAGQPFTFVVRHEAPPPCPDARIIRADTMWVVGHCAGAGAGAGAR